MNTESAPSLSEAIPVESILIHPDAEDRASVLRAIMAQLVENDTISRAQANSAMRGIGEREAIGSTAIGGGVAIPHARVRFSDTIIAAYALLKNGSDFNALDGETVQHVFLILSPKDDDGMHISFLKSVTQFANIPIHRKALSGCQTPADVHAVFVDYA